MIKKFEMFNENYGTIIDGELVDTYGGDSTYRDVWYEIENGEYFFYEILWC